MKKQSRSIDAKFGTLRILSIDPEDISKVLATCRLCGNTGSFTAQNLIAGRTKTCGSLSCIAAHRAEREAAAGAVATEKAA
jgi:hypothetical protein